MKAEKTSRFTEVFSILLAILFVSIVGETLVFAAVPSNDNFSGATPVGGLPYSNAINTADATVEGSEPAYTCGWNVGKTVWYSYTPSSTGEVVVDTSGSNFSTVVHVFNASGMIPVGCNGDGWDNHVLFTATFGETYLISIGGYNGYSGDLVFNMDAPGPFTTCASVDVSQAECNALETIYTTNNGSAWYDNSGWLASDVVCTWYGISCSSGSVVEIDLHTNNLGNDISTVNLTSLSNLFRLNLAVNNISGDLLSIIGNLPTNIVQLYLYSNEFTGTIPAGISSFSNLTALNIGNNFLVGDIAAVITNLPTTILYFDYTNNGYYGTIPAAVSGLTNLLAIYGFNNFQDGDIAAVIGNLPTGLNSFDMSNNNFTGTIPASISSLTNLYQLDLGKNDVSGDLTTIIGDLPTSIEFLQLSYTNITGTIPASISNLTIMSILELSGNPGLSGTIPVEIIGLPLNTFDFEQTFLCEPTDGSYAAWKAGVTSYYPGYCEPAASFLFEDDFETSDFSLWTRFNDGNGYLYPCMEAAMNGAWGACVDRGTDKRKQLIDETPINQTDYNVRFNIDMNSLSMGEGERFRFMQVKMGAERPFFIVLKRQGGQYLIQLNTLLDDRTKVKTGWYSISNAPHTLEVSWAAATGLDYFDGSAVLYLDDSPLEVLGSLDNDTIFVDTFKIGFTSRLNGKTISGIFYLDDIATTNNGHIGLP